MVKEIQLTQGYVASVDDEDFERVNQFKWYAHRNKIRTVVYGYTKINKKSVMLHRFIMKVNETKIQVDHRNGDGLDCKKVNMRLCLHGQNQANGKKYKNCSSKYKGVYYSNHAKKWAAQVATGVSGKPRPLGYFNDEKEAAKAYDKAALELHGEFALINFP